MGIRESSGGPGHSGQGEDGSDHQKGGLGEGVESGPEAGGGRGQVGRTCDRRCCAVQLTAYARVEQAGRGQGLGHGWCYL